jgi:hypothetical protein
MKKRKKKPDPAWQRFLAESDEHLRLLRERVGLSGPAPTPKAPPSR